MSPLSALRAAASPLFLLGAAHSGKSELAQQLLAPDREALVLGTATVTDPAFARRLARLRALRPGAWDTVEVGADLPAALAQALKRCDQVLVDSLNLWIAGLVIGSGDEAAPAAGEDGIEARVYGLVSEVLAVTAKHPAARVVFVSSETGAGPAPARVVERLYRRLTGESHQRVAAAAKTVPMVYAGVAVVIKG